MQPCIYALIITVIELTSSIDKSGRLAVCQNETIVYRCRSVDVLTWNVDKQAITFTNDSYPFVQDDERQFFAYLQNTNNYLLSYLAVPYIPDWNGMTVQCMLNEFVYEDLPYNITGKEKQ